jgi:hypothetical protein
LEHKAASCGEARFTKRSNTCTWAEEPPPHTIKQALNRSQQPGRWRPWRREAQCVCTGNKLQAGWSTLKKLTALAPSRNASQPHCPQVASVAQKGQQSLRVLAKAALHKLQGSAQSVWTASATERHVGGPSPWPAHIGSWRASLALSPSRQVTMGKCGKASGAAGHHGRRACWERAAPAAKS